MDKRLSNLPTSLENNNQSNPTYEVGYKKPPVHTQFKKGQSGNQNGRPKGAKNKSKDIPSTLLADLILEEAYREISVHEGDKTLTIPMVKAALRSLAMNTAKGKHYSQRLFLKLVGETQTAMENKKFQLFEAVIEYKQRWNDEIDRAKAWNQPIPDPIPHPEHLVFDPRTGDVRFIGPMSKEEKKEWDLWVARKLGWIDEIKELEKELKDTKDCKLAKILQDDIDHIWQLIDAVRKMLPDDIFIPPSTLEFVKTKPDLYGF